MEFKMWEITDESYALPDPSTFDIENAIDVVFEDVVEEEEVVMAEEEVEEVEVKRSSRAKAVVCLTTGMVFDSMKAAAEYYGLKSANGISKCCNGKQKTSGKHNGQKLVWQFA